MENDRTFQYEGITIDLQPGIFHPKYFKSSLLLIEFAKKQAEPKKHFLEIGSGSGIASLVAAKHGAEVTALDINKKAVDQLIENAKKNKLKLTVIESDLLDQLVQQKFDCVLINPPFYPKKARSHAEHAWFCGENYEYFIKLFEQLDTRGIHGDIYMTLSSDCQIDVIFKLAAERGYSYEKIETKRSLLERNYLFELKKDTPMEPAQKTHQE